MRQNTLAPMASASWENRDTNDRGFPGA